MFQEKCFGLNLAIKVAIEVGSPVKISVLQVVQQIGSHCIVPYNGEVLHALCDALSQPFA